MNNTRNKRNRGTDELSGANSLFQALVARSWAIRAISAWLSATTRALVATDLPGCGIRQTLKGFSSARQDAVVSASIRHRASPSFRYRRGRHWRSLRNKYSASRPASMTVAMSSHTSAEPSSRNRSAKYEY